MEADTSVTAAKRENCVIDRMQLDEVRARVRWRLLRVSAHVAGEGFDRRSPNGELAQATVLSLKSQYADTVHFGHNGLRAWHT